MQAHEVVGAGGEEAMGFEGGRLVVCLTYCVWDSVRYSRKVWQHVTCETFIGHGLLRVGRVVRRRSSSVRRFHRLFCGRAHVSLAVAGVQRTAPKAKSTKTEK